MGNIRKSIGHEALTDILKMKDTCMQAFYLKIMIWSKIRNVPCTFNERVKTAR